MPEQRTNPAREYINARVEEAVIDAIDILIQRDARLGYGTEEVSPLAVIELINDHYHED